MKKKHRGYAVRSGYGPYLAAPGDPVGNPINVEKRWRVILASNNASPGRIVASCIDHASAVAAAWLLAVSLFACGGSPFTVAFAEPVAGDDAAGTILSDALSAEGGSGEDSAPSSPDGDRADGPMVDAGALEASLADVVSTPDAGAANDAPAEATADAPIAPSSGLCCRSETVSGLLVYTPLPVGTPFHLNDYGCVDSGPSVVAACPDGG